MKDIAVNSWANVSMTISEVWMSPKSPTKQIEILAQIPNDVLSNYTTRWQHLNRRYFHDVLYLLIKHRWINIFICITYKMSALQIETMFYCTKQREQRESLLEYSQLTCYPLEGASKAVSQYIDWSSSVEGRSRWSRGRSITVWLWLTEWGSHNRVSTLSFWFILSEGCILPSLYVSWNYMKTTWPPLHSGQEVRIQGWKWLQTFSCLHAGKNHGGKCYIFRVFVHLSQKDSNNKSNIQKILVKKKIR